MVEQGIKFGMVDRVRTSSCLIDLLQYIAVPINYSNKILNDSNKKSNDPPVHYTSGAKVHMYLHISIFI